MSNLSLVGLTSHPDSVPDQMQRRLETDPIHGRHENRLRTTRKAGESLLEVAPSSAMPAYKLYCLDDQGHIKSRIEFVGDNDEAAIAHVRQHHFDSACEIWDLGRLVARMPRIGPSSGR
jgi:hypothetical protein